MTMSPATTNEITHPADPEIPISCPEVTNNPIPIVPLKAIAVADFVNRTKENLGLDRLTGYMVSFESSVKSVIVEKPTGEVTSVVIVVGIAVAVLTCVVAISLVGRELKLIVQVFGINFD